MKIFILLICFITTYFCHAAPFVYVANAGSGNVSKIDTQTNTVVATLLPANGAPFGLGLTPDLKTLYVGNNGNNIIVPINVDTGTVGPMIPVQGAPTTEFIAASPDGKTLFTAAVGCSSTNIGIVNVPTNTSTTFLNLGPATSTSPIFAPNGLKAYISTCSNGVKVLNTLTNTFTTVVGGFNPTFFITLSPDGLKVLGGNANGSISIMSTITNTILANVTILTGANIAGIGVTLDGKLAYVGTDTAPRGVGIVDLTTYKLLVFITNPQIANSRYLVIPNNQTAYVLDGSATSKVFPIDLATNTFLPFILVGAAGRQMITNPIISAIPFSLNGKQMKNDFGFQYELFNKITWSQTSYPDIVSYYVYKNDTLMTSIPFSGLLEFEDHNLIPDNGSITYSIVPVNSLGNVMPAQSITLP